MIRKRFEELKHIGQLPSPSGVGLSILKLVQQEDFSMEELVAVIQVDPAITGRVLRVANSPLMGGAMRICTVRDAAVRLGTQTVSNLALGFSIINSEWAGRCRSFDYPRFWSLSLAHAVAAQALGRRIALTSPPQAFTCALLSRIGQLALASTYPEEYSAILEKTGSPDARECQRQEAEAFQIDNHQVSVELLTDWGLPDAFCQAAGTWSGVRDLADIQNTEVRELVSVLRFSNEIAEYCLAKGGEHKRSAEAICGYKLDVQLSHSGRLELVERAAAEWAEWGKILSIPTHPVEKSTLQAMAVHSAGQPDKERREIDAATAPSDRMRVLAVDDDAVSLRLLVHHLQRAGFAVITATNGQEALGAALQHTPHIVVADWMMPVMDGIDLCKRLHKFEAGRRMYMVLLTGREGEDRVVEAFEAGVDDYVAKPFNPRILLARVRAGQRAVQQRQELESKTREIERQKNALSILSRRLESAANTDVLTGLANRRFCMERLGEEWQKSAKTGQPLALVMLDIDHFKRVNDQHGHCAGDDVLREVAGILGRNTRLEELCARIGGEEFLVVCRGSDAAGAAALAERMRLAVASQIISTGSFNGQVTISIGVAQRGAEMARFDEMMKQADLALYQAKTGGRNRVVVAGASPDASTKSA